jgi:EAL domain-containing protein (putative c-di-GMP-specific phosphodiesterase class I)
MAHSLGIRVVAEGVETEKQYKTLKKQDCDFIQGYFLSKPLSISELYKFLDEQNQWNHQE